MAAAVKVKRLPCSDDLEASLEHAWAVLERGAKDGKSRFHIGTLATVDERGWPAARSVVLRECHRDERWLRFNTDNRSEKVDHCQRSPNAVMHFYSPEDRIQLRARVRLEVLAGEALSRSWDRTAAMSRICYQVTQAPGSPIEHPYAVETDSDATHEGEINFASIRAYIEELEWLYLNSSGHRRARFRFDDEGVQSEWLIP